MQTLRRRGHAKSANPLPSKGPDESTPSNHPLPSPSSPSPVEFRPAARLSVRRSLQDAFLNSAAGPMILSLQRRTSTADLSDFLRDTGPPPTTPPPVAPAQPVSSTSTRKTRLFSQRLSRKDAKSVKRLTSDTFTPGSRSSQDVAPPNTEPKVFANGQRIYMINTPTANNNIPITSTHLTASQSLRLTSSSTRVGIRGHLSLAGSVNDVDESQGLNVGYISPSRRSFTTSMTNHPASPTESFKLGSKITHVGRQPSYSSVDEPMTAILSHHAPASSRASTPHSSVATPGGRSLSPIVSNHGDTDQEDHYFARRAPSNASPVVTVPTISRKSSNFKLPRDTSSSSVRRMQSNSTLASKKEGVEGIPSRKTPSPAEKKMSDLEWEEARQKERVAMLISAVRHSIDEQRVVGPYVPTIPKIPVSISNPKSSNAAAADRPVTSPQQPSRKVIKLPVRPSLSGIDHASNPSSAPIQALEDAFFTPQSTPVMPSLVATQSQTSYDTEDVNVSPSNTASTNSPSMPVTPTPASTGNPRYVKVDTAFHAHPRVGPVEDDSPPIEFRGFKFPTPPPQPHLTPPKATSIRSSLDDGDVVVDRRRSPGAGLRPAQSSSTLFFDKQVEEILNMDKAFRERAAAAKDQDADDHDTDEERETDNEMMVTSTETETESEADGSSSFVNMGARRKRRSAEDAEKRKSEASTIGASGEGRRVSVDTAITVTSISTSTAGSTHASIATEAILGSPVPLPSPSIQPPLPSKAARRRSSSMRLSTNSGNSVSTNVTAPLNVDGVKRFSGGAARAKTAESHRSASGSGRNTSLGLEGLGFVGGVGRPPKMPLPPSPTVHTPPNTSSGLAAVAASTSSQAQITALTYALHTQRTRYENLSSHVVQLSSGWEDERRDYEGRIGELMGVVSALEGRIDSLRDEFEGERFRWEREREGLRWLVEGSLGGSGTEEVEAGDTPTRLSDMRRSATMPSIQTSSSLNVEGEDDDERIGVDGERVEEGDGLEEMRGKREAAYFGSASSPMEVSFPHEIQTATRVSRLRNGRSSSRSRPASLSLRDSSLFLQPSSSSMDATSRRRSMHESSDTSSNDRSKRYSLGSTISSRPLSAALDDMIIKLQTLEDNVAVDGVSEE